MLNLKKPLQLEDGRPAKLLCTDRKGTHPIVVLIPRKSEPDEDFIASFTLDGLPKFGSKMLVNVPPKVDRHAPLFVKVYNDGSHNIYKDRIDADYQSSYGRRVDELVVCTTTEKTWVEINGLPLNGSVVSWSKLCYPYHCSETK